MGTELEKLTNKKGLFVFSDPGGAKSVLSIAHELQHCGEKNLTVLSDRRYDFYNDFGVNVINCNLELIHQKIEKDPPEYVFTGTSYTSTIEIETLKIAAEKKVKSYAFVDHWTNIKKRFLLKDHLHYPNELWLIDSKASKIALTEGVPEEIIKVTGNPYYKFIQKWNSSISRKNMADKLNLELTDKSKLILYAPEPFSNIGGVEKFGFDENTVLKILIASLKDITSSVILLVKPHPNQKIKLLEEVISNYSAGNKNITLVNFSQTNDLIYHSDLIVGISSNILIEASIMGKNILRFCPIGFQDPLNHLKIGVVVNTSESMHLAIQSQFH